MKPKVKSDAEVFRLGKDGWPFPPSLRLGVEIYGPNRVDNTQGEAVAELIQAMNRECWWNAARGYTVLAALDPNLRYVEGWVADAELPLLIFEHGWLETLSPQGDRVVVDPSLWDKGRHYYVPAFSMEGIAVPYARLPHGGWLTPHVLFSWASAWAYLRAHRWVAMEFMDDPAIMGSMLAKTMQIEYLRNVPQDMGKHFKGAAPLEIENLEDWQTQVANPVREWLESSEPLEDRISISGDAHRGLRVEGKGDKTQQ